MNIKERQPKARVMAYALRPLEARDIPQAGEIERDAFPTLWPPTPFRRELQNRMASYLVARRRQDVPEQETHQRNHSQDGVLGIQDRPFISQLVRKVQGIWWGNTLPVEKETRELLTGFVGTWFMVDEAHITSIGVRTVYRGNGIGELLLIGAIEQAMARRSRVVTLEVRVSNGVAQSLYEKYGFQRVGLRKRYYTDNNEDATIMTTDPILEVPYLQRFRDLVESHRQRWGETLRILS